jgi:hypothetical protein
MRQLLKNCQAEIAEAIMDKLLKSSFKSKTRLKSIDNIQRTQFLFDLWQERLVPLRFHTLLFTNLMHQIKFEYGLKAKLGILEYFRQVPFLLAFDRVYSSVAELWPVFSIFFQEICNWFLEESPQSSAIECLSTTVRVWYKHVLVISVTKTNTIMRRLVRQVREKIRGQRLERERVRKQKQESEDEMRKVINGLNNLSLSSDADNDSGFDTDSEMEMEEDTKTGINDAEIISGYPKLPE